jgi:predicted amidohydrolase YtcJ
MNRQLHTNFVYGLTGERQEMLVENGLVITRSASVEAPGVPIIDHAGKTLIPPFIDSHCHILPTGLDLLSLNLGQMDSIQEVLDAVRDERARTGPGWLIAVHYDQNRYGRHVTLAELDAVSDGEPTFLRHVSGHSALVNSSALQLAGIDHDTKDPEGGSFERGRDGRLTGVLLEHAMDKVMGQIPRPTVEQMAQAILAAGESMRSYGIACASDMHTGFIDLEEELDAYRIAAERGCKINTRLYLRWSKVFGPRAMPPELLQEKLGDLEKTNGRVRVAGIKIFADGAIGSGTAAIYGTYAGKPESPKGYSGQMIYTSEKLDQMVKIATEAGYQVSVHSIGDYSTDRVMDAFEKSGAPQRHRIEHAMLLSDAQIERMAKLNCFINMQPEFLVRFGQTYKNQLGQERAARIKRMRSVLDAGLRLSLSSDRPIVTGDPKIGIALATNRPEGFDPTESITFQEALRGYTVEAAAANGDTETAGTFDPGAPADFLDFRPEA